MKQKSSMPWSERVAVVVAMIVVALLLAYLGGALVVLGEIAEKILNNTGGH